MKGLVRDQDFSLESYVWNKEKDDKQKSLTSFFVFGIIRDVVKL